MVFAVARMAGWVPDDVVVRHVPFGLVLGEGGKRMRTRSGDNGPPDRPAARRRSTGPALFVAARAEERGEPPPDDVAEIARVIGIGGGEVHRAQPVPDEQLRVLLRPDAQPQGQHRPLPPVRLRPDPLDPAGGRRGQGAAGAAGARRRSSWPSAWWRCPTCSTGWLADDAPNHLCTHLFDLSQAYNSFYEHCPVLRLAGAGALVPALPVRPDRRVLRSGLALLGIEVVERI